MGTTQSLIEALDAVTTAERALRFAVECLVRRRAEELWLAKTPGG